MTIESVDIRPGVSVLAVLRHLNYRPWFALGEFVDNAVQSFSRNREALLRASGDSYKLRVDIDIDPTAPTRISIKDNAGGIAEADYARAFRPAALPLDRSGLAEFGMGMKSAACWFAPRWSVRTSALGEPLARTVNFDIANIVNDDIKELFIVAEPEQANSHYTEILLEQPFHVPVTRTLSKLKEHLTDIYRVFIREGSLDLRLNRESLVYEDPPILRAPYFRDKDGPILEWRKEINFDLGDGLSVRGFAALREPASTTKAGFALFRRSRLIQGSGDEGYRPALIFGQSNSYRYQRLFGELHLDGFEVSHTKDGFRWDENEQAFLELLREHLDDTALPLLRQAEGYRSRPNRIHAATAAEQAVANATQALENRLPAVLPLIADEPQVDTAEIEAAVQPRLASRQFDIVFRGRSWTIVVEVTDDPAESQWLALSDSGHGTDPRLIDIRLSMSHPFMVRFAQGSDDTLEALLRAGAALAVGEVLARDSGVRNAGTIRRNVNDILRQALSDP